MRDYSSGDKEIQIIDLEIFRHTDRPHIYKVHILDLKWKVSLLSSHPLKGLKM